MKTALITGASGLLGSALIPVLERDGWTVRTLSRRPSGPHAFHWNPAQGVIDALALDNLDLVIHLAGEGLLGRWTAEKRRKIVESRETGTRFLLDALIQSNSRDVLWISASGAHFYQAGETAWNESGPAGGGFLAGVCRRWESAAGGDAECIRRRVFLRTGMVLSNQGGALAAMRLPFKLCLGGRVGDGSQWVSWIHRGDWCRLVQWIIAREEVHGPVNAVSPNPVRQVEFAKVLGSVLHRPALLPAPAFAVKLLLGQMGKEMLLESVRVLPGKAESGGFRFQYPRLEDALVEELSGKIR